MSSEKAIDHYRLPTDLRPRHYDLIIRTDLEKEKFSGFVKIQCAYCYLLHILVSSLASLDILKATKVVTFNAAAELNLRQATLVTSSSTELPPVETKIDTNTQRVSLMFAEELPAGSKAILHISFEAVLTDSMTGYYKSTWERGTYTLTQFEVREFPINTRTEWPYLLGSDVQLALESTRLDKSYYRHSSSTLLPYLSSESLVVLTHFFRGLIYLMIISNSDYSSTNFLTESLIILFLSTAD
jgi:hypothetical protein